MPNRRINLLSVFIMLLPPWRKRHAVDSSGLNFTERRHLTKLETDLGARSDLRLRAVLIELAYLAHVEITDLTIDFEVNENIGSQDYLHLTVSIEDAFDLFINPEDFWRAEEAESGPLTLEKLVRVINRLDGKVGERTYW